MTTGIGKMALAACFVAAAACGGGARPITVRRPVEPFHSLEVAGPMRVSIESGEADVRISGDPEAARGAGVEVREGVLVLESHGDGAATVEARVRAPDLRRLVVSGAADVDVDLGGTARERLEIVVAGAGAVTIRGVDAGLLGVDVAGAADLTATGRAGRLEVVCAGAGNLDLGKLCAETADVALGGAGQATVVAAVRIDARIDGAGLLRYFAPHELPEPEGGGKVRRLPEAGSCGR
jgi:hypothetical protein